MANGVDITGLQKWFGDQLATQIAASEARLEARIDARFVEIKEGLDKMMAEIRTFAGDVEDVAEQTFRVRQRVTIVERVTARLLREEG